MVDLTLLHLKVWARDSGRVAAQLHLPAANRWTEGAVQSIWLAPNEWLFATSQAPAAVTTQYQAELRGTLYALMDTSDAFSRVQLSGSGARQLLAMGAGVDFDSLAFRPGHCARTRLAKVPVLIRALPDEAFDLFVDRSLAAYVHKWLTVSRDDPALDAILIE